MTGGRNHEGTKKNEEHEEAFAWFRREA